MELRTHKVPRDFLFCVIGLLIVFIICIGGFFALWKMADDKGLIKLTRDNFKLPTVDTPMGGGGGPSPPPSPAPGPSPPGGPDTTTAPPPP